MRFLLLLPLLLTTACASIGGHVNGTPYVKRGKDIYHTNQGYFDEHINNLVYHVGFWGNGVNKPLDVRKKFLRRSRELAQEKGFKGFCIIKDGPTHEDQMFGGVNSHWKRHEGDIKLSNEIVGDQCFNSAREVASE